MAEKSNSDISTICRKYGIKPITRHNLVFYYAPIVGAINYSTLSVNIMNPELLAKLFPRRDVTNILFAHSFIGSALYIYNRPHLQGAPQQMKLLYSGFNSLMFNFGSVLLWAVLKSVSPRSNCIATIIGLIATAGLITAGNRCLDYVDSRLQPAK